jgi:hypothetical protein
MKNADIAQIFNNIADLLEIKNENPFRIRAYRKAALNIAELGKDVSSLSSEELLEIPGIGHDLEAKIEEYLKTGRVEAYEKLKQEVPESLIELLAIPGLGPKTSAFSMNDKDCLERLARNAFVCRDETRQRRASSGDEMVRLHCETSWENTPGGERPWSFLFKRP